MTDPTTTAQPYDPALVLNSFGWLWCDIDGAGTRWELVNTYGDTHGGIAVRFVAQDPDDDAHDDADLYRGHPYVPLAQPQFQGGA